MKKSVCMKGNDPLIHTDYRIGFFPHSFQRKMKSDSFDRIVVISVRNMENVLPFPGTEATLI